MTVIVVVVKWVTANTGIAAHNSVLSILCTRDSSSDWLMGILQRGNDDRSLCTVG